MKKTLFLLMAALCLAACKTDPDDHLPADPHVPLVNPFIGIWKAETEYWQFRPDGTGGKAAAETGPFPDGFSFFIYAGQDVQAAPSGGNLVILDDSGGSGVTRYSFSIAPNHAVLNLSDGSSQITLERVNVAPSVLSLKNPLIGEWSATWDGSDHNGSWSLKYRADGTVKTYHQGVEHQFENAYALRGDTLVIFGEWRFSSAPVTAGIQNTGGDKWHVIEKPPNTATWDYTKVEAAKWK
jgi:hypothetical protein